MPSGLLIDLNDGGPRMEITAGMRCPSYLLSVADAWNVSQSITIPRTAGSDVFVAPKNTVDMEYYGPNLIPTIMMLDSCTVSGNTLAQNIWWSDSISHVQRTFAATVWEILPISTGSAGLLISNSTDFTAITNNTKAGFCVWRGDITFTGSWTTPTTSIPRSNYVVFAKWSAAGVTIEFDGNVITAYQERDGDNVAATVTMRVAIFASGIGPTPGTGLNIINAQGQCVFSTTSRPFVYLGNKYTPSWNNTDIGDSMIMLGRYGFQSIRADGWSRLKWAGLVRSGNVVRCARGRQVAVWDQNYSVVNRRLTGIDIPCIPAIY